MDQETNQKTRIRSYLTLHTIAIPPPVLLRITTRPEKNLQRERLEMYDTPKEDENWRQLASFGVERNQDFDMDETFGQVQVSDDIEGVIEVTARISGAPGVHEFGLKVNSSNVDRHI